MVEAKAKKSKANAVYCRSWLVGSPHRCDGLTSVYLNELDQTVGAGLLAKAVCQSCMYQLTHCFREQARSHSLDCGFFRWTEVRPSQASQLPQKSQWLHIKLVATEKSILALDLLLIRFYHSGRLSGRRAFDLLVILILGAPLNHAGRTQVLRSG